MKRWMTGALLGALVAVSGAGAVRAEPAGLPPPANRWALIVSIEDYPPAGAAENLPGCDLDGNNVTRVLQTRFGFPAENITRVKDLDATKARIVKELTDLADRAKPGDAVVFYYSGHGAMSVDLDGDEDDGWDEAIVPADPRPAGAMTTEQKVARLLLDDEIAKLTQRFKTGNVTMIFDSCHSGTVTLDDPDQLVRSAISVPAKLFAEKKQDQGWTQAEKDKAAAAKSGASRQDDGMADKTTGMVVLSASQPWETSGCTDEGGFFTNALVRALDTDSDRSWDSLFAALRPVVLDRNPKQSPRVDGNIHALPFSANVMPASAGFVRPTVAVVGAIAANSTEESARWKYAGTAKDMALVEGYQSLYLEQTGAIYDVYPEKDAKLEGKPKGRVRITGDRSKVTIYDRNDKPIREDRFSTAEILSGDVVFGDRLVLVAGAVPSEKPRVLIYVPTNLPEAVKNKLLESGRTLYQVAKAMPMLDVQTSGRIDEMDYVLQPISSKTAEYETVIWSKGGLYITSVEGDDAEEVAEKIRDVMMARHGGRTRLVRLHNASPAFRLRAYTPDGELRRSQGDAVQIRVETGEPVYLTVMGVDSAGHPVLIQQTDKPVGGEGAYTLSVEVPKSPNELRMPVKIIATRKPLALPNIAGMTGTQRVTTVATALRQQVGDGGAGEGFLDSAGWADATVMLAIAK